MDDSLDTAGGIIGIPFIGLVAGIMGGYCWGYGGYIKCIWGCIGERCCIGLCCCCGMFVCCNGLRLFLAGETLGVEVFFAGLDFWPPPNRPNKEDLFDDTEASVSSFSSWSL